MRTNTFNAALGWGGTLAFAAASAWPRFSAEPFVLKALRPFAVPQVGWPMVAVTLGLALALSLRRFATRDWGLVLSGFSVCLFVMTVLYVSMPAALLFSVIGGNLLRDHRPV